MKHALFIAFPDTNCLLHYPCIRDIDWRSLCDSDVVQLILSRQVIAELDEKKSHPTMRDRAERAIHEIRGLLKKGGYVREKVTIESFKRDIPFSEYPPDLNTDSQDDRIICQVMKCAEENAPIHVAIVSEDLGMELRCETFNIRVIEPPRADRLPNPTTDLERERNKAIKELQELKNRTPDIRIKISSTKEKFEDQFELALCKYESTPIDIESEIARKYEELAIHRPSTEDKMTVSFMDQINRRFIPPAEEYARYEKDLEAYLRKYKKYLESKIQFDQSLLRIFKFWIKIENVGNTPASEVRVDLQFPAVLQALASEDEEVGHIPKTDKEPKIPTPPRNLAGFADIDSLRFASTDFFGQLPETRYAGAPNISLTGDAESGFLLDFVSAKLSHHEVVIRGPFLAMFREGSFVKPFQVVATITADELPVATQKRLHIIIGKKK